MKAVQSHIWLIFIAGLIAFAGGLFVMRSLDLGGAWYDQFQILPPTPNPVATYVSDIHVYAPLSLDRVILKWYYPPTNTSVIGMKISNPSAGIATFSVAFMKAGVYKLVATQGTTQSASLEITATAKPAGNVFDGIANWFSGLWTAILKFFGG